MKKNSEVSILKEVIETLLYIVFVFVCVWFILTFVGQRTIVNGPSMENTLHDQESLWLSKASYKLHEPKRFDIVVFPSKKENVDYIKRIIGLPGERVRIDERGNIFINDQKLQESFGKEVIDTRHIGRANEEVKLGKDEYFVMGDNRNNSLDSRYEEVGNIKLEEFKGKVVFRLWPIKKFGMIK